MIPLVLFQNFSQILNFFILVLKWRKILRQRNANLKFIELTNLMNTNINLINHAVQLMVLIMRWLKLRKRRKRFCLKPHLLLQLLGGYR